MTGRILLDLAPEKGNPRNSEGAFYRLKSGALRLYYSRFAGDSSADEAYATIAYVETLDEGESWSTPVTVFTARELDAVNIMSVSMMEMGSGDAGLFFLIRRADGDLRLVLYRSSDDCRTWSGPVCCIPEPGYYVVNNDRVVRLSTGRLLVPAAFHARTGEGRPPEVTSRAIVRFSYSDDDGATWQMSPNAVSESMRVCRSGFQEPGVAELRDGSVYGWARTDLGRQYEFFSRDGGISWTEAEPAWFTSPCSPMQTKRMPDGRLLAVWNPIPAYQTRELVVLKENPGRYTDRTRYVLAVSDDEGETWSEPRIFEDDADAGFSYPAMYFTNAGVFLAYCAGKHTEGGNLCRERIRFIPYSEIG